MSKIVVNFSTLTGNKAHERNGRLGRSRTAPCGTVAPQPCVTKEPHTLIESWAEAL